MTDKMGELDAWGRAEIIALRALEDAVREWARRFEQPEMGTGTTDLHDALDVRARALEAELAALHARCERQEVDLLNAKAHDAGEHELRQRFVEALRLANARCERLAAWVRCVREHWPWIVDTVGMDDLDMRPSEPMEFASIEGTDVPPMLAGPGAGPSELAALRARCGRLASLARAVDRYLQGKSFTCVDKLLEVCKVAGDLGPVLP